MLPIKSALNIAYDNTSYFFYCRFECFNFYGPSNVNGNHYTIVSCTIILFLKTLRKFVFKIRISYVIVRVLMVSTAVWRQRNNWRFNFLCFSNVILFVPVNFQGRNLFCSNEPNTGISIIFSLCIICSEPLNHWYKSLHTKWNSRLRSLVR